MVNSTITVDELLAHELVMHEYDYHKVEVEIEMETKKPSIDWTKPLEWTDESNRKSLGKPEHVADLPDGTKIVRWEGCNATHWYVSNFSSNTTVIKNAPESKRKFTVYIYENNGGDTFSSLFDEDGMKRSGYDYKLLGKAEIEEGEGL